VRETMMLKADLVIEVKCIRKQLYDLKIACEAREDRLIGLLLVMEPFINALAPSVQKQLLQVMEETADD
jgi:hypothetical protein